MWATAVSANNEFISLPPRPSPLRQHFADSAAHKAQKSHSHFHIYSTANRPSEQPLFLPQQRAVHGRNSERTQRGDRILRRKALFFLRGQRRCSKEHRQEAKDTLTVLQLRLHSFREAQGH